MVALNMYSILLMITIKKILDRLLKSPLVSVDFKTERKSLAHFCSYYNAEVGVFLSLNVKLDKVW